MFSLRYYQMEARDGVREAFEQYRSTAVVLPTGCGKTELYLSLAVEESARVLVLVHRDYLITSPVERLERAGFKDVAIEKGDEYADRGLTRSKIVFASVQSIGPEKQSHRLNTLNPAEFSLLVIDEGHRAVSPSYRRVKEYFEARNPRLKTLILTATPKRKDGVALGNVCESVAYEMSPATAAEEGWIVRPRFFVREVPELDFSKINLRGSDLDADQVAALLTEEEPLHKVCASLAEDQGPTIVFCPKVAVAEAYAAILNNRYRRNRAAAISQHSTDDECERATKGLADGSIDWLLNVDKVTEGYDVPKVVRVAWAAPTASLVRWMQGCGRGFRPDASVAKQLIGNREDSPGRRLLIEQSPKPFCSIVTYHPSNCQHQICTGIDLLGGHAISSDLKSTAEQVQEETARQGGGSDTEYDLETAQVVIDLRAVLDERRKHLKAKAKVADAEFDGLGGAGEKRKNAVERDAAATTLAAVMSYGRGEGGSEKQLKWFSWKKIPVPDGATKFQLVVVRDLIEFGVQPITAFGWNKATALSVRDKYKTKQGEAS